MLLKKDNWDKLFLNHDQTKHIHAERRVDDQIQIYFDYDYVKKYAEWYCNTDIQSWINKEAMIVLNKEFYSGINRVDIKVFQDVGDDFIFLTPILYMSTAKWNRLKLYHKIWDSKWMMANGAGMIELECRRRLKELK